MTCGYVVWQFQSREDFMIANRGTAWLARVAGAGWCGNGGSLSKP
jgi:hypothetical protein